MRRGPDVIPCACLWTLCQGRAGLTEGGPWDGGTQRSADDPLCRYCYPACQRLVGAAPSDSTTSSGALLHTVFTSFSAACTVRDAWDALAAEFGDMFCSFDWCALWWAHYGQRRRLEIHVFSCGAKLVGVAPCFRETLWCGPFRLTALRLVGCDSMPTVCGLVLHPAWALPLLEQLAEHLLEQPADVIQLGRLPGYCWYDGHLVAALSRERRLQSVTRVTTALPHAVLDLAGSEESYLGQLSHRERYNIRHENRRLVQQHALCVDDAGAVEDPCSALREFIDFHQRQWSEVGHRGHYADWPGACDFHRDMAFVAGHSARLRIRRVRVDGAPFCMEYAVRFGSRLHWLQSARSLERRWSFCFPGRVGAVDLFKQAIREGVRQVDMGIGFYEYKLKLGAQLRPVAVVTAVRRGLWPTLRVCGFRAIALLHELLGHRLWYLQVARRWRGLRLSMNRRWIRTQLWPADAHLLRLGWGLVVSWPGWLWRSLTSMRRNHWPRMPARRLSGAGARQAGEWCALETRQWPEADTRVVQPADLRIAAARVGCALDGECQTALRAWGGRFLWYRVLWRLAHGDYLWLGYRTHAPLLACWAVRPERAGPGWDGRAADTRLIDVEWFACAPDQRDVLRATLSHMVRDLAADGVECVLVPRAATEMSVS